MHQPVILGFPDALGWEQEAEAARALMMLVRRLGVIDIFSGFMGGTSSRRELFLIARAGILHFPQAVPSGTRGLGLDGTRMVLRSHDWSNMRI